MFFSTSYLKTKIISNKTLDLMQIDVRTKSMCFK